MIAAEKRAMTPIAICPTIDRSVLGIMVDFAKSVPYLLEAGPWTQGDLCRAEDLLAKTPCHAARSFERVIFPDRKAPELLSSKWLAN